MITPDQTRAKDVEEGRSIAAKAQRIADSTDTKYGKAWESTLDSMYRAQTARINAQSNRVAAQEAIAVIDQARKANDAIEIVGYLRKNENLAKFAFTQDARTEAVLALETTQRIETAAKVVVKTAAYEMVSEALRPGFTAKLVLAYESIVSYQPKGTDTIMTHQAYLASSAVAIQEIESLAMLLAKADGANTEELRRLRAELKNRGTTLATLSAIQKGMRSDAAETPHARARKAHDEQKALDSERSKVSATLSAKSRKGTGE